MPFQPTDIPGLKLWLRGEAITGLADGAAITTWPDSSGLGNDAAQGLSGARPTFRTNIINGRPVVRFDGVDDYLSLGTLLGRPASYTIYAVLNKTNVSVRRIAFGSLDATGAASKGWGLFDTNLGGSTGSPSYQFGDEVAGTSSSGHTPNGTLVNTTFAIFTKRYTSGQTAEEMWKGTYGGGNPLTVTPDTNTADENAGTAYEFAVGRGGAYNSLYWDGDLPELLVFEGHHTTEQRQAVEGYLGEKYFALSIISPTIVHRHGETPLPHFTLTTGTARWTATAGVLLTSESPRVVYNGTDYVSNVYLEPANRTGTVTITATTAGLVSAVAGLFVYGVFPLSPDWGYKPRVKVPAKVSMAEDELSFRVRYKGGDVQGFEFTLTDRSLVDWEEFEAFRAHHRIHLPWYFYDPETELTHKLRFDQLDYETERRFDSNSFSCLARQYAGPV